LQMVPLRIIVKRERLMYKTIVCLLLIPSMFGCVAIPIVAAQAAAGGALGAAAGGAAVQSTAAATAAKVAAGAAVGAAVGTAIGYGRGKAIEAKIAEEEAVALRSATGFDVTVATAPYSYQNDSGKAEEISALKTLEMPVSRNDMMTEQGALQPRAAVALARMDAMAQQYGAQLTVYVPPDAGPAADAIKSAAPNAMVEQTAGAQDYRLTITPPAADTAK